MIFGDDRTRLRQQFSRAWQKHQAGEPLEPLERLIAEVVAQHPEYHALLDETELQRDFSAEAGQDNPFLHMGMHIALVEQLATDRPPGIRELYQRLVAACGHTHEAEHRMMACLGQALWEAQRAQRPPDEQAYRECLRKLL